MSASFVAPRYTPTSQVIHWLSALLVCLAWILGLFGDEFPKGVLREAANFIHISAGEIIAFLLILHLRASCKTLHVLSARKALLGANFHKRRPYRGFLGLLPQTKR